MSYKAKISWNYHSEWTYDSDFLPEENITMEFPAHDLSSTQLFGAFRKFLLATGQTDSAISSGAVSLAFNENLSDEQMRKTAEDYDLVLREDHINELMKLENKIQELEGKIIDLKAHLSRAKDLENPNYTDDEMEAMCSRAVDKVTKKTLENAYKVCRDCGNKYGTYVKTLSSWWEDTCDVCGEHKPTTEARDFAYLKRGIEELKK